MVYVIKHMYLEQQPFNLAYFIRKKKLSCDYVTVWRYFLNFLSVVPINEFEILNPSIISSCDHC